LPKTSSERSRRRHLWARGDLTPVARPEISPQQWRDPTEALDQLRAWAEDRAVETITWYLRDKKSKRWASRLLRAAAVSFAVIGGVVPLISSSLKSINSDLGYLFLAIAAGCVAFDHFFGLSSGWMRDIAALQALQSRLIRFHLDWAKWQAEQAGAIHGSIETSAGGTSVALGFIDVMMTEVAKIADDETAQWIADFSSSLASLRQQSNPGVTSPQDLITWGSKGELSSN
jgi:hypothetical protein